MSKAKLAEILCQFRLDKWLRLSKRSRITILCLHRVSNDADFFFEPLRPEIFENLVKYVTKYYRVISLDEIPANKKASKKPLLIFSFDDGYYDFYEHVLPVLDKYKLPSNHNIVNECANTNAVIWTQRLNHIFNHCRNNRIDLSFQAPGLDESIKSCDNNWIRFYIKVFRFLLKTGKKQRLTMLKEKENQLSTVAECRMMSWREIEECSRQGVEIGSHTYSHDSMPTVTDDDVLAAEIAKSKTEIEERIKKPVTVISLPNGQGNKWVDDFIRQTGYKYLLYVNDRVNDLTAFSDDDFIILNRINLLNESLPEIILRTELFHSRLQKYV